jgi:K+ transporter
MGITSVVANYFVIRRKTSTIILTTTITCIATILYLSSIEKFDEPGFKRTIHPIAVGYCIWQVLTTITIGRSLTFEKAGKEQLHLQNEK